MLLARKTPHGKPVSGGKITLRYAITCVNGTPTGCNKSHLIGPPS